MKSYKPIENSGLRIQPVYEDIVESLTRLAFILLEGRKQIKSTAKRGVGLGKKSFAQRSYAVNQFLC